ncbi:MAG: MBL fold metallo-hydrolase [Gammaproteobacteria bacterium]|nr:MBL fold metallo-hydrolase [Gammaproteobacteria bacterium]MBQ0839479.1 MBL fold metallo-hydrolase [Gammaproteobacteria bacterium]
MTSRGFVRYLHAAIFLYSLLATTSVFAEPYPIKLIKVADNVYSAIGETQPPNYENGGHNNNLSFIIGSESVLVVNGGDSYLLAKAFHQAIKRKTKQAVRWVVNENGQGHAFLGNSYWSQQGVAILAQKDAAHEIAQHGRAVLARMLVRNKDKGEGTFVAPPTETFDKLKHISLGNIDIEVISFGAAHSPGDISVWLPKQSILIVGDMAFHQRLLGVFPDTNTAEWIVSFEKMAALQPRIVIPGHGAPTTLAEISTWTLGYLKFLRAEVAKILDDDGELDEAYNIDQSAYSQLDVFDELAAKNAGRVFQEMEAESF